MGGGEVGNNVLKIFIKTEFEKKKIAEALAKITQISTIRAFLCEHARIWYKINLFKKNLKCTKKLNK